MYNNITIICTISGPSKLLSIPSAKEIFRQVITGGESDSSTGINVATLYVNTDLNYCSLKRKVSVLYMATEFFPLFPLLPPVLETCSLQLEPSHCSGVAPCHNPATIAVPFPQIPENDYTKRANRNVLIVLLQHLKEVPQVKSSGSGEKILNHPGYGQVDRTPFCSLHLALWPWFLCTTQRPVHCLKHLIAHNLPFLNIKNLLLCCPPAKYPQVVNWFDS